MADLLQSIFGAPGSDQSNALGLLGTFLMGGRGPEGFQAALQHMAGAEDRKMRRDLGLLEMQRANLEMQKANLGIKDFEERAAERRAQDEQKRAEQERIRLWQESLPSLMRQGGMVGGEPVPQTIGDVPMFSLPMGAAPMRQAPGGFDVLAAATKYRMKPEEIKAYADLMAIGRPKVARTVESTDAQGRKIIRQLGDDGIEIGEGIEGYVQPVQVNTGDKITFAPPIAGTSMDVNMSPAEADASKRGWASHGLAQQRFNLDRSNAVSDAGGPTQAALTAKFGKAPPGWRWKEDGSQEAIPGGPADTKAGVEGEKKQERAKNAIGQADVVIGSIDDALKKAGWWETGLTGAVTGMVPGTNSYDLRRLVETVKANIGFDKLQQMREMSPTGGALGQVAVQELNYLQATLGNLDANQGPAEVRKRLNQVKEHYNNWRKAMESSLGVNREPNAGPEWNFTPVPSVPQTGWGIQKVK